MLNRTKTMAAQHRAGRLLVFKARLPSPNDDGWMFFTAHSVYHAGKRREDLGLIGGVKRASIHDLRTIAIRALDDF